MSLRTLESLKNEGRYIMNMTKKEFTIFSAPSMILMVVLMIVPLLVTIVLSFCTYNMGETPKLVGFSNYYNLITNSPRMWTGTIFSLVITAINVVVRVVVGTGLALMLYSVSGKFIKKAVIGGALIPFSITPVVSTMMFSLLFKDNFGLLPYLLSQIGIDISWFSETLPAQALIVIHSLWGGVPFTVITLYSGLLAMPLDPLKAAQAEGASLWQKIRYVIVPYLSPLLVFNTMTAIMAVFRTYDSVAVMTKGGPGVSTETIQYYNMQVAFSQKNIGQGSAMAIISILWIFLLMAPLLYMMYREQLDK